MHASNQNHSRLANAKSSICSAQPTSLRQFFGVLMSWRQLWWRLTASRRQFVTSEATTNAPNDGTARAIAGEGVPRSGRGSCCTRGPSSRRSANHATLAMLPEPSRWRSKRGRPPSLADGGSQKCRIRTAH